MSLFVPVNDPADVRRELLTASKDVIGALRRYEHFHELRKAKLESFHQLHKEWQDLAKLMRKLKSALPKTDIKIPKDLPKLVPPPTKKAKPAHAKPQQATVREHRTKLDLLEQQLSKIEGKLSSLE